MTIFQPRKSLISSDTRMITLWNYDREVERIAYSMLQGARGTRSVTMRPHYPVRLNDENGEIARFLFDFHVEFENGARVAVAIISGRKNARFRAFQTRLETTGRIEREDGSLARLTYAFDDITFITEEWVRRDQDIGRPTTA